MFSLKLGSVYMFSLHFPYKVKIKEIWIKSMQSIPP